MANKSPRELFEEKVYISPKGVLCNQRRKNQKCPGPPHLVYEDDIECHNCGSSERVCATCREHLKGIHVCRHCNSKYSAASHINERGKITCLISIVLVCVGIAAAIVICMKFEEHGSIIHNRVVWKDKGHIKASPDFNELDSRISELETYIKAQAARKQIPAIDNMIDLIKSNPAPVFLAFSLFANVVSISISIYVCNLETTFTAFVSLLLHVCLFLIFYGPKN